MLNYTNNNYKNTRPVPKKSEFKKYFIYSKGNVILSDIDGSGVIEFANIKLQKEFNTPSVAKNYLEDIGYIIEEVTDTDKFNLAKKAYNKHTKKLELLWMVDLAEEYGIDFINDPIGRIIFRKAWETGHSCGLSEVDGEIQDLISFTDELMAHKSKSQYYNEF